MQAFEGKVKSMTSKEIIMAMVNGIRKEWVKLDFNTFGENHDGICYGCAATNAICEIAQKEIDIDSIDEIDMRAKYFSVDDYFLSELEFAFDDLRYGTGYIHIYNSHALGIGIATIKEPDFEIKKLSNYLTKKELNERLELFEKLAEIQ